ncbi:MAG: hypothetical protein BAA02_12735 [Paenibacillaceae bacterium ZCTH02-B3]|nr:MAG: hypothetical protein BAA02_12735 [Paenibacillaceae bacterium ZCTH02-B3]
MKGSLKRILLLFLVMTFAGAGTVLANSVYDYVRARQAVVTFNGKKLSEGYLIQTGKHTVPAVDAESLLGALGGYMRMDEKTGQIDIFKPNVQVTVNAKNSNQTYTHTHKFKNNRLHEIQITVTADGVTEEIEAMQLTILDPSGQEIRRVTDDGPIPKSMATSSITQVNLEFLIRLEKTGLYTVEFSVKPKGEKQFFRVGKTVFESVE